MIKLVYTIKYITLQHHHGSCSLGYKQQGSRGERSSAFVSPSLLLLYWYGWLLLVVRSLSLL